ncbi:MAG: 3-alpha,7-alpha,12-alpha-trihydroxy-5-beta-cholest-24-enoyl-CoA hydratase [Comamonadaceae bacterium]|nr:MAG: 3-alpha,7-alpha,12-alpha-trihydroxy-5-beta-cholest-24-enoyl-CoA hydratase [Comamonadaceae bacterium]
MTIDYHRLKNWNFPDVRQRYTEKDSILYALGLGFGMNPTDEAELRFVYEKNLLAMPTMAVVLGYPGFWMEDPATGIDWTRLLHGEQRLRMHRSLPSTGEIIGRTRVKSVTDKGAGKGAIVVAERTVTDAASGALLATLEVVTFCRGDGGYSGNGQPSDTLDGAPPTVPDSPPQAVCDLPTRPEMALVYRLSADPNPLHADPAVARAAGFERPILHGMATYGVAARAILKTWCADQPERLKMVNLRFTAPVYPGETLRTEMWQTDGLVRFRARVLERDLVVLNNGVAECSA